MHTMYYIILILSMTLFASVLTLGAYLLLTKLAMLDQPNDRSNHDLPIVTGVGVGFMTTIISFLVVVNAPAPAIIGAIILLIVSVMDDRSSLKISSRFGFQLIAVVLALHLFEGKVFQGLLPVWLDMLVTAFIWLWVINMTNFMDGIDGMTVTELSMITGGIMVLGFAFEAIPQPIRVDTLVIFLGVITFIPWNKHPARCFMGDAGSVPLGYLLGYLLFSLAEMGFWQLALILPAYYICDATITLILRLMRGEAFWRAHSKHFYQKAVRSGRPHNWVTRRVFVLNLLLIGLAAVTLAKPEMALYAIGAAYAFSLVLCLRLGNTSAPQPRLMGYEATA